MFLFDERELTVFDSQSSRDCFKEILQLYHNQNYRSAVVMLYSFVAYDLYVKLSELKNLDDTAKKEWERINQNLTNEKISYSQNEHNIVEYFQINYKEYFRCFNDDLKLLIELCNKCVHLMINKDSLFIPKDYEVRMLICSMYDNILSAKPLSFIGDFFEKANSDIDRFEKIVLIEKFKDVGCNNNPIVLNDIIRKTDIDNDIKNKYIKSNELWALTKNYKKFICKLFLHDKKENINYYGLYAFVYSMTDYIVQNNSELLREESLKRIFASFKISAFDTIVEDAFIALLCQFPVLLDNVIGKNSELHRSICQRMREQLKYLFLYDVLKTGERDVYQYFEKTDELHNNCNIQKLYTVFTQSKAINNSFNLESFLITMINAIPSKEKGFDSADNFMNFYLKHIRNVTPEVRKEISAIYDNNTQCTKRRRHNADMEEMERLLNDDAKR